ncbi:alpha-L-rhamnosidase-related protein [Pediococcus ethanolidurans]|uniref:Alpha-L-rhamnosidase n=1 Tax=Pediococcus ethanolidurans TaxID=319653 RepID=A0A0R2K1K1_9LACO|nr:amylo-alpha-1,6-glucosidase [Pediococcus ethanolidurans]KRN83471.1 ram1 protein [Pediococcus ethanolidurans]GEN94426.1 alpha-L-rhamnosidase [Pediococcus ethanolidurans]SER25242.1 alpha-L-rhamnosidase [Pediococcus ethanolidurans]
MAKWIWYHGDFEIYHAMKQNFDREERGMKWPAYWYTSNWNHNVYFFKEVQLHQAEAFTVTIKGEGYGKLINLENDDETKFSLMNSLICPIGHYRIEIYVANLSGLPCAYIQGQKIQSDESWQVSNFLGNSVDAGTSKYFLNVDQNPMNFKYTHEIRHAKKVENIKGGVLFDFGHDLTAKTVIKFKRVFQPLVLCYGESRTEALDVQDTYLEHQIRPDHDPAGNYDRQTNCYTTKLRAFRYIYIPDAKNFDMIGTLAVDFEFVKFPRIGDFSSSDSKLTKIWQVSDRTLRLCSGIFFIDGIKRDRWIWAGDAFQCFYMNRYDFFDKELVERTILGLRGELDIKQHLDTIVDYSMYWLISIELYYDTFADKGFLKAVYPKMKRLIDFSLEATDEKGFIHERKGDWIYIDWADFDHQGPLCAEQMVLARALQSVIRVFKLLNQDTKEYTRRYKKLRKSIDTFYWNPQKHAYIDSYESGKDRVSRHANIFAILFDYADKKRTTEILQYVLLNPKIAPINTPYFKFWELEAFAKIGYYKKVLDTIKSYWGGMLDNGATTFWEYFDPNERGTPRYAMYGDKYGKSLCHAWGSSPLYLIGRYLIGLKPTHPGYVTFELKPQLSLLGDFKGKFPINAVGGYVALEVKGNLLTMQATQIGGTLLIDDKKLTIPVEQARSIIVHN